MRKAKTGVTKLHSRSPCLLAAPPHALHTRAHVLRSGEDPCSGCSKELLTRNDPGRSALVLGPARLGPGSCPGSLTPRPGLWREALSPRFLLFVPGCGCLELGFNFPAPAACGRSPAGGAKSELSERMPQRLLVFLSWASGSGVLGSTDFAVISAQKDKS